MRPLHLVRQNTAWEFQSETITLEGRNRTNRRINLPIPTFSPLQAFAAQTARVMLLLLRCKHVDRRPDHRRWREHRIDGDGDELRGAAKPASLRSNRLPKTSRCSSPIRAARRASNSNDADWPIARGTWTFSSLWRAQTVMSSHPTTSSAQASVSVRSKVPVTTLDSDLEETMPNERVALIKIDVEGFEPNAVPRRCAPRHPAPQAH